MKLFIQDKSKRSVNYKLFAVGTDTVSVILDDFDVDPNIEITPELMEFIKPELVSYMASGICKYKFIPEELKNILKNFKTQMGKIQDEVQKDNKKCKPCEIGQFFRNNIKLFLKYFYNKIEIKILKDVSFFLSDDVLHIETPEIKNLYIEFQNELKNIDGDCKMCDKKIIRKKYIDKLKSLI